MLARFLIPALLLASSGVVLADTPVFKLSIQNNRFQPEELHVPAGQKVKLLVQNHDAAPEEFESYDLNREKIIMGKSRAIIYVGPLQPGKYSFFGDFHQDTARGRLIVD